MPDLFDSVKKNKEPLAARMRPRNLDEYIGQDHIVGKGRLLRRAIAADQLSSVIFYGPPGSGKTTLARVIANHTKSNFITLNAVLTGVQDIRTSIKQAEDYFKLYNRRTILFVDEVHRWNKSQQDALLPWVENGTIILVGATTENPFFEVNKALVSRSRVFQLKALTAQDLEKAAQMALADTERGYGHWKVQFESGALEHLIETANGDARSLLNALELAVETTPEKWEPEAQPPVPEWGSTIFVTKEAAEESIQKKVVLYDRDGDYHYDIISAFIKSLRGRDPDGAMYWLARMVRAGEDPHFIFRRMLISACEDTGLADPYALSVVESCADAFDRVGLPEGRYHLAHAALYLATTPKSNSSMAFFDALAAVEKEDADVPNHLRDSNRDAEGFGHGAGYLYPHAYKDHWVAQQYLPDALAGRVFYTPSSQGWEKNIRDDVLSRRELQIAAILNENAEHTEHRNSETDSAVTGSRNSVISKKNEFSSTEEKSEFGVNPLNEWWVQEHFKTKGEKKGENLTFTPKNPGKESALERADKIWKARLDSNRCEVLLKIRNTMTAMANLTRHERCLVWDADDGLLLWELARKTPEGITCGVCRSPKGRQILEQYSRTLETLDKPILEFRPESSSRDFLEETAFREVFVKFQTNGIIFDRIFFRDPFISRQSIQTLAKALKTLVSGTTAENSENQETPLASGWKIVICQRILCHTQHVLKLVAEQILGQNSDFTRTDEFHNMEQAEKEFFSNQENPLFNWDAEFIAKTFEEQGFKVTSACQPIIEKRRISDKEIFAWFDSENSSYSAWIAERAGQIPWQKVKNLLSAAAKNTIFNWETETAFFTIQQD